MDIKKADKNMIPVAFESDKYNFYDPRESDIFKIEGLPFLKANNGKYYRLDINEGHPFNDALVWLCKMPAGGQIHFKTDSKTIVVKIKNNSDFQMCHMTPIGQRGVDLYFKRKQDSKYNFFTSSMFNYPSTEFESRIFNADEKEEKDIIINLPLYGGIDSLLIGIEKDATLLPSTPRKNKGKIVYYGTSIAQGGCASRPGMLGTNIMSRDLDYEFVNLGFSGSGMGEPFIADVINSIDDKKMIVFDYEANGGCTSSLEDHMEYLIDTIRSKNPTTPILVITKQPFTIDKFDKEGLARRVRLNKFQKDLVNKKKKEGDNNIYYLNGLKQLAIKDYDECYVDGLHHTDLGFYLIAKYLDKKFKEILSK